MNDMLFEVPKNKTRLEACKEKHGIETLDSDESMGDARWVAVLMPSARQLGYGLTDKSDFFEVWGKVCRLLDETGLSGYGKTEVDAVVAVCRQNGIEVVL